MTSRYGRVLGCAALLLGASLAAWGQAPDATEIQFWKSAANIGTRSAYAAYLARYPLGVFAPLAGAALDKVGPGTALLAAPSPASAPGGSAAYRAKLTSYSGEPASDAFAFRIGDKFYGPGTIEVGRSGARKQILIPNGEWVALAAVGRTITYVNPVSMVSAAWGQFDGSRLRSLLVVDATSRKVVANPNRPLEWKSAEDCEGYAPDQGYWHHIDPGFPVRACMDMGSMPNFGLERLMPPGLWNAVLENLGRLAASTSNLFFDLNSVLYVTDNSGSYLSVFRLDCVGRRECGPGAPAPSASVVKARVDWAKAYFPLAARGFSRNLAADELSPSTQPRPHKLVLPD